MVEPAPREDRAFLVAAGACGLALAWILTSARWLALVNWDNGSFLAEIGTSKLGWSSPVWNAHFGAKHVYLLAWYAARAFGGTPIDGYRVADALSFAANTVVIASATRRLARDRWVAALLTAAWATSWVMIFLLLTLEDNILFLAPAAGVLWLCALRADRWGARESLWAGLWAALACLMSWQALLYLGPAFYCAAVCGPRSRPLGDRARAVALLFASFAATLLAWCLVMAATSKVTLASLVGDMFSRPKGSFVVRSLADVAGQLRVPGVALSYFLAHTAYDPPKLPLSPEWIGALFWTLQLGVLVAATLWARRVRRWPLHVLAATLCLFSFVTPLYKDVEYRYLIRYDFVPPIVVMLIAGACGELRLRRAWRWQRVALATALAAIVFTQSALAGRWDQHRLAVYPTLPTWLGTHTRDGWYGREGKSWYAYFRGVRQAHPDACRQVLAFDEVADGRWNFDIVGALWSELPRHEVIAPAKSLAGWRYPPRAVEPAAARKYRDDGCTVFSDDARRLLGAAK